MKVLDQLVTDNFSAYNGDCVEVTKGVPDNSIHYTIFSPPFESLYTYSNSVRDMGNCASSEDFHTQFQYLISELYRVTMPGRLLSFHCMNLPTSITNHGYIGIRDFRGELIREFQEAGWVYHSEVCIWKDPVVAMQRTKALGLLHKQLCKDSARSRQGIPDYLVTMRKPGDNPERVEGPLTYYSGDEPPEPTTNPTRRSIDIWQRYASPIWTDINQSDTLQKESAREQEDERHICPLQLGVIERALQLWTNENDVVLSPFMGIGSEGYRSLEMGRRFVGIELKESYYRVAVNNLNRAANRQKEVDIFDLPTV